MGFYLNKFFFLISIMFPFGGSYFFQTQKTPLSGWMYPPKNVSMLDYMQIAGKSKLNNVTRYKFYAAIAVPISLGALYLTGSAWADQKKSGGTFYVDLSNDEGLKLMGPPCPKAKAERELNRLMQTQSNI